MNTLSRRELLRTGSAAALGLGLSIGRRTSSSAWTTGTPIPTATPVDTGALEQLRKNLTGHGQLLLPNDEGFGAASAPNNGRYLTTTPVAVAVCADEVGVVTCVNWCRDNNVPPVARGGGHSYGGFSTTDGLIINIGKLNSVDVESQPGIAAVGGAALNEDLFAKTVNGQYFLPVGTCPKVGVGGLVLGGGIGYNTYSYGLTCDHLLESRIVTADGQVLDIKDDSPYSDLFWACRGGAGGSFGINTSFTFRLQQVPVTPVSYYRFDYQGADAAAQVFGTFHQLLQFKRPGFNAVAWAQATPIEGGNKRDAISVVTRGQFFGPKEALQFFVQPLLNLKPKTQELMEYNFWDLWQQKLTTAVSPPHSYGDISRYAKAPISSEVIANLVNLLADCPSRTATANGSIFSLGWVGGVVNTIKPDATAYVHRDAMMLLRPTTVWPNNAERSVADDLNAWTKEVIKAIGSEPYESYQNFPNRDIPNSLQAYYGDNLAKLTQVKTTYDKNNLFRNQQSIPPQ